MQQLEIKMNKDLESLKDLFFAIPTIWNNTDTEIFYEIEIYSRLSRFYLNSLKKLGLELISVHTSEKTSLNLLLRRDLEALKN